MGTFADVTHLSTTTHSATPGAGPDRSIAFQRISLATADLTRDSVRSLIGTQGGMISGGGDTFSSIIFPFRDGNRSARASREMARSLGVGTAR